MMDVLAVKFGLSNFWKGLIVVYCDIGDERKIGHRKDEGVSIIMDTLEFW